ncbi:MAG: hypothetical protein AAGA30_10530, partial [Planctomycetota bacterium]
MNGKWRVGQRFRLSIPTVWTCCLFKQDLKSPIEKSILLESQAEQIIDDQFWSLVFESYKELSATKSNLTLQMEQVLTEMYSLYYCLCWMISMQVLPGGGATGGDSAAGSTAAETGASTATSNPGGGGLFDGLNFFIPAMIVVMILY